MAEQVMASKTMIFIVLEFVTGGELFDKIVNHGRMREDEAGRYFQQLIDAVDYCHHRGVLHKDMKPENLLLDCWKPKDVFSSGKIFYYSIPKFSRVFQNIHFSEI